MLLNGTTIYQNVVQINKNERIDLTLKNSIHEPLKGTWCIANPKGHYEILPLAEVGTKSGLFNGIICHGYLMIALCQFQFAEDLGLTQAVKE